MTEERYSLDMELVPYSIVDLYTGDTYPIDDEGIFETVVNLLNKSHQSKKELEERINRQANTIAEKCAVIDNYIDVKAKLAGKIEEYSTKSEEYELGACACGSRKYAYKRDALEEFKEEVYQE